jgi:hypothetical protein
MLEVQVGTVADSESRPQAANPKPQAVVAATPCRPEQPTEALHLTWAPRCTAPVKQGARLIKLTAACCGCTVRTTANGSTCATGCARTASPWLRSNPLGHRPEPLNAPDPREPGAFKRSLGLANAKRRRRASPRLASSTTVPLGRTRRWERHHLRYTHCRRGRMSHIMRCP